MKVAYSGKQLTFEEMKGSLSCLPKDNQAGLSGGQHQGKAARDSRMLDWNVLPRQEPGKVPEGTLSCPD